jgi:hypothetical protein
MLSEPVCVSWAGFQSDTLTLHQEGWSFSAEQDVRRHALCLAMKNAKLGLYGISEITDWDFMEFHGRHNDYRGRFRRAEFPVIRMQAVHRSIVVHHFGPVPLTAFRPIDPIPQFSMEEPKNLEDLVHFAPINFKRIILPEDTVPELMARILEVQQPAREEHFMDQAKKARVHAQLVSIPS